MFKKYQVNTICFQSNQIYILYDKNTFSPSIFFVTVKTANKQI